MEERTGGGAHVLTWSDVDGTRRNVELRGDSVTIGRAPGSAIELSQLDVSRAHCVLDRDGDGWSVRDDKSLDGTYVNDLLVSGSLRLHPGDVIRLGRFGLVELTYRRRAALADDAAARPPAWQPDPSRAMLQLLRRMSTTLDVEDVLGLALEGALEITRLSWGVALLDEGGRLEPRVRRGAPGMPDAAALTSARRVRETCSPRVDASIARAALPLRTFEGDRLGRDHATGLSRASGVLLLEGDPAQARLGAPLLALVEAACDVAAVHVAHASMYERATRDALTGLRNRGWFDRAIGPEMRRCSRNEASLALAIIDVDRFKSVNDAHGHPAGDCVLQAVAATLRDAVGTGGAACRYGGEEFVLLLPGTDPDEALALVEGARQRTAAEPLVLDSGVSIPITFSAGLLALVPADGLPASVIVAAADQALLRAKEEGRNRTCVAPPVTGR